MMKMIVWLVLAVILYSLGSAAFYFFRDKDKSDRMVKALTWRVGLSIGLFLLLFLAFAMGWLTPHSL